MKTLKKKAAGKKLEETTVFEDEGARPRAPEARGYHGGANQAAHSSPDPGGCLRGGDADQMKPEELIRRLKETVLDLRAEAVVLRNERESSQFVKAQNLARMQLYEDTLSSTEKLLADAHQRLHAATTELSQKNYRIAELEARLYNKSVSKKQLEDLRTKGDLRDKEMIAVRARVEVLEKENAAFRQQIDLLTQVRARAARGSEACAEDRATDAALLGRLAGGVHRRTSSSGGGSKRRRLPTPSQSWRPRTGSGGCAGLP